MIECELPTVKTGQRGWPWEPVSAEHSAEERLSWPRVSIVTPSFNQGEYIEETIRSVLLQGYPNLEYIIIDGGSTDETLEILNRYDEFIDFWVSKPDKGQSDAINQGLERVSGDWFNWVNSDDLLQPGALFALVRAAMDVDCVCVSGRTETIEDGVYVSNYSAYLPADPFEFLFSLRVNQPGSLMKAEIVQRVGGIREPLNLVMDLDLWIRLALEVGSEKFVSIADDVAVYRLHADSKTCAAEDAFALEEFAILTDLLEEAGGRPPKSALRLRALHSLPTCSFDGVGDLGDKEFLECAWLERMIVSDSLFFRALRKTSEDSAALNILQKTLNEFGPWLRKKYGRREVRRLEGLAILHAMQISGLCSLKHAMFVFTHAPSIQICRALIREVIRR